VIKKILINLCIKFLSNNRFSVMSHFEKHMEYLRSFDTGATAMYNGILYSYVTQKTSFEAVERIAPGLHRLTSVMRLANAEYRKNPNNDVYTAFHKQWVDIERESL
jgi:hypothetical protein